MKTTIVNEAWHEKVDVKTGEVLELEHSEGTKTIIKQEPPYVKMYIDDVMYMADMPKAYSGLTYSLLKRATYADKNGDGLHVYTPVYVKQEICKECGFEKLQSLTNALGKLCKASIIKKLGTGAYQLNPFLFGRGEWKDIDKIRMTWEYDIKGKSFATCFTYKQNDEEAENE